jgi:hypothetical protein
MIYIIGIILHILICTYLKDNSLIVSVLYNYKNLDMLQLISILSHTYWLCSLYHFTFQYEELDEYINIRCTKKDKFIFYIKKLLLFISYYSLFQIVLLVILKTPYILIIKELLLYVLIFLLAYFFSRKETKTLFMFIFIIILKLII